MITWVFYVATAQAAGIIGDEFTIDLRCVDCLNNGAVSHLAALPASDINSSFESAFGVQQDELFFQWLDEDRFVFGVAADARVEEDIALTLAGLNVADGGPRGIACVSVNPLTDCPEEFGNCPDAVRSTVSTTTDSITVSYSQSGLLSAYLIQSRPIRAGATWRVRQGGWRLLNDPRW